jgi:Ca-activated chloride channel family protein
MTRATFRSLPALLAAGFLLQAAPLQAGPIFVPGQLEGNKFIQAPGVPCHCYSIRFSTSTVTVEKDAARVEVEEVIDGPEKATPAVCLIPLPDGVSGASIRVSWSKTGAEPKILGDATFLDSAKAQKMYETIARGGLTKILAFTGRPAILVPTVDLGGKGKMSIAFSMAVKSTQGVHTLTCPMPAASYAAAPVERVTVNVHLTNKHPLRSIFSPTHTTTITRKTPTEATATVKADRWTGMDDFRLYWAADTDALGLRVLAHRANDKEDGYFVLLGNPAGAAAERAVLKDVIFVLDTSGSMRGERIEQARAALDYCIQHLDRTDRFNIVTFGTDVKTFKNDLVDVTPENLKTARAFIEDVVAHGQTNIAGALQKALAGKAAVGRERIMIFVTDGAPTVGERSPDKIIEQVKKQNNGTRIFVMGVGNDVNAHLLDQLAEVTDGSSEYFAPREELDAKVAALYDRLSHPVLSGVKVSFGESGAQQVLPSKVPVLFKGSEIMMVGRYKKGGKHTFTIAGTLAGRPVAYTCEANLPGGAGETSNEFLAPLWAARQIGYLLQEIRLRGANKELIEEVVRLSKQYGIVTEYTEFIAAAGPSAKGGALYAEAGKRLAMARQEQAGQWAVNQAHNDRQLQNRAVAGTAANTYRDRRGKETTFNNINLIGQRAFYLQDGQWVDAEEAGTRKTRVVKILSPEYFELLKKDATFAKAQQLGWALSINVGAERIVIEKDGKQKDETLIPKADPTLQVPGPGGLNQKRGRGFEQQIPGGLRNQLQRPNGGPNQGPIPPLQQNLPQGRKQQDQNQ